METGKQQQSCTVVISMASVRSCSVYLLTMPLVHKQQLATAHGYHALLLCLAPTCTTFGCTVVSCMQLKLLVLYCMTVWCRQRSDFFEDPGIEQRFRSKLDDYYDSGYDRGHMVSDDCASNAHCIRCQSRILAIWGFAT